MSEQRDAEIDEAHRRAEANGDEGYFDPRTGLFVLTAQYLRDRGTCCDSGCRHCPYKEDQGSTEINA